jgi:hypothetical protein
MPRIGNSMKLLFLLLSFNLYALTPIERLAIIDIPNNNKDSQEYIARLMQKCSSVGNSAFYYSELIKPENEEMLKCFEDKRPEIDKDKKDKKDKRDKKKTKSNELNNYDCSKVKDKYAKLLCEERN